MTDRSALWASGIDETVEVNQRALIDKVLARYSGEFTVFRELLQNADDASATRVELHFQTQNYLDLSKARTSPHDPLSSSSLPHTPLPDLKTATVAKWIFKNDGVPFRDEDWNRLKKIAEGNPDEAKIGAFGVGFYSLFSVTEAPFVTSHDQWMGFYWKNGGDQLFVRRGNFSPEDVPKPAEGGNPWTSFEMDLRDPGPLPGRPVDMARFLAQSLTFVNHINNVSLYFDDHQLVHLVKQSGAPRQLGVPNNLNAVTPGKLMSVQGISSTHLLIKASVLRWVYETGTEKAAPKPSALPPSVTNAGSSTTSNFLSSGFFSFFKSPSTTAPSTPRTAPSPLPPPVDHAATRAKSLESLTSSVQVQMFSADVRVDLRSKERVKMAQELERATKKKPPSVCAYQLIYTGKEDYDESVREDLERNDGAGSVFQGLRADLDGKGSARMFIGHATAQTTGIGGHNASRFIPTVEREAIDLVDATVSIWNKELLGVGGFLARAVYEFELASIASAWKAASSPSEALVSFEPRFLHLLKFFSFHQSTPSTVVSQLMESAFFNCSKDGTISLLSSAGVKNAKLVRKPNDGFSGFLKSLPTIPKSILQEATVATASLAARGLLRDIAFADIIEELNSRSLTIDEMVACLKWRLGIDEAVARNNRAFLTNDFLRAATFFIPAGEGGTPPERVVSLGSIKTYLNPSSKSGIPIDGPPVPLHTLPFDVSKRLPIQKLQSAFGWAELSLISWITFLASPDPNSTFEKGTEYDLSHSAVFAERVLSIVAKASGVSGVDQERIVQVLKGVSCVPTTLGMRKPEEAYMPNVSLFEDLAILALENKNIKGSAIEKLLLTLGVRRHVELQLIFTRVMASGKWSIFNLITYLVSVKETLTSGEMEKLRKTAVFTKVGDATSTSSAPPQRYTASQLYEPSEKLSALGLPTLDWAGEKWNPKSAEAKFMYSLNLQKSPSLDDILSLASSENPSSCQTALQYFLDNFKSSYIENYDKQRYSNLKFIPARQADGKIVVASPSEVFLNDEASCMGFLIVSESLKGDAAVKLQLDQNPPSQQLLMRLISHPPKTAEEAQKTFSYLASQNFDATQRKRLSLSPFVPIIGPNQSVNHVKPTDCYIGRSTARLQSKLFTFVDFGTQASLFLRTCGTKDEPTTQEVAVMLVSDPVKFYEASGGTESYLEELRRIAVNLKRVDQRTQEQMRRTRMLLGYRQLPSSKVPVKHDGVDDEPGDADLEHSLLYPQDIVIVDETTIYQLFREIAWAAPQDDAIENFYALLGARTISALVQETYDFSGETNNPRLATDTRALVLERLPLFLHDQRGHRTRFEYSWLAQEGNLQIKVVGKLKVISTLNQGKSVRKERPASVAAKRDGRGPVVLLLAQNDKLDHFELAHSICRLLFEQHRVNDSLLFMTVLSTDLRALQRRGYNVTRILNQQKLDREKREKELQERLANTSNQPTPPKPLVLSNSADTATSLPPAYEPPKTAADNQSITSRSLGSMFKEKFQRISMPSAGPSASGSSPFSAFRPQTQAAPPVSRVTPSQDIERNMQMAISACREEHSDRLQNRSQMSMVKESLNDGYCDITGEADIHHVADVLGYRVFVSHGFSVEDFKATKIEAVRRFTEVITPLRDGVYKVPPRSIAIFYDVEGPLIAFNRGGSIFLNLRYYEAWHDVLVQKGDFAKARISWYFVLAHEIAHNLVQPHNSEHEFYFSSLCEHHLLALSPLLTNKSV